MIQHLNEVGDPPQDQRDSGLWFELQSEDPPKSRWEFVIFLGATLLAIPVYLFRGAIKAPLHGLFQGMHARIAKAGKAASSSEPPAVQTPPPI